MRLGWWCVRGGWIGVGDGHVRGDVGRHAEDVPVLGLGLWLGVRKNKGGGGGGVGLSCSGAQTNVGGGRCALVASTSGKLCLGHVGTAEARRCTGKATHSYPLLEGEGKEEKGRVWSRAQKGLTDRRVRHSRQTNKAKSHIHGMSCQRGSGSRCGCARATSGTTSKGRRCPKSARP